MSIYNNPTLVKLLMEERIREAREASLLKCCMDAIREPKRFLRSLFLRRSPAACTC